MASSIHRKFHNIRKLIILQVKVGTVRTPTQVQHTRHNGRSVGTLTTVPPTAAATSRLQQILKDAYAPSTMTRKARVQRLISDVTTAEDLIIKIDSTKVSPATQLAYLGEAMRIKGYMLTPELRTFKRLLHQRAAQTPIRQATPLPIGVLKNVLQQFGTRDRVAIMIAWKTASRWAEVQKLKRENFLTLTDTEIVIAWGAIPKGAQLQPYRKDMFTIISGEWTREIAAMLRQIDLRRGLSDMTTDDLSAMLHLWTGTAYTAHSIKRGALTHLVQLIPDLNITMEDVQRLAKHKELETTLRYIGNQTALAHALDPLRITQHL